MLACRPTLVLAAAIMAGALVERHLILIAAYWPIALAICLAAITGFLALPPAPPPTPTETMPESYRKHILPVPGFWAKRGLNKFMLLLGLGAFFLGMTAQHSWQIKLDPDRLPNQRNFSATLVTRAPSRIYPGQSGPVSVAASLVAVNGKRITPVPVRFHTRQSISFRRGDMLRGRMQVWKDSPRAYPGAFDYAFFRERDGLAGTVSASGLKKDPETALHVTLIEPKSTLVRLQRTIDTVRGIAIRKTLEHGGEYGGILAAMLFGYRQEVDSSIRDSFRRIGIGHVLAISGLHVGLVVIILWRLVGWLGLSSRWRAVLCLILAVVFWTLTGGQTAATRATLMAVIHLAGMAWGNRADMLNSLGAAAFFITLANPGAPLDVSFQLSFIAVVFIYMAMRSAPAPEAERKTPDPRYNAIIIRKLRSYTGNLIRLSVATWIGLFPIIAIVFHQVNLAGLPINIFVIPLMSIVLACGLLIPWFGWVPGLGWLLAIPTKVLVKTAGTTDAIPGSSFPVHPPGTGWVILFYLAFAALMTSPAIQGIRFRQRWRRISGTILVVSFICILVSMRTLPPPPNGRISLLPGSGFAMIAAEAPNGEIALLGSFKRGGMNEAGWLHYLHRKGMVATVGIGKLSDKSIKELPWHYPISAMTSIPASRKTEANAISEWLPVPGAEAIEYATARDASGKLFWMSVRTGEVMVTVIPRISTERFANAVTATKDNIPGNDADVFSVYFNDPETGFAPDRPDRKSNTNKGRTRWFACKGRMPENMPPGSFNRGEYGTLVFTETLTGYNGSKWVAF